MEERYDQYGGETILDLKETLVYTLRQWRRIAIFALVGAILFAGINGGGLIIGSLDKEYTKSSRASNEAASKAYKTKKAAEERQIKTLTAQIETQEGLQKDSIFLNLNPYDVCKASRIYYVDTGYQILPNNSYQNIDKTRSVIKAYTRIDKQGYLYKQVKKNKKIDISARSYTELVRIWADEDANFLNVVAYAEDKKTAKTLLDETCKALLKKKGEISKAIASHDMKVNKNVVERTEDNNVAKRQKKFQNELAKNYQKLSKLQKDKADREIKKPRLIPVSATNIFVRIIKWLIIGAFIGFILGLLWFAGMYIVRGIIGGKRTVRDRCNIKVLGSVEKEIKGYCFIDKLIDIIDGVSKESRDKEVMSDYIAASLQNISENENISVISSRPDELIKEVVDAIDEKYSGSLTVKGDILTEAEALRKIEDSVNVILVEERLVTKHKTLASEVEMLRELDKNILGLVLV